MLSAGDPILYLERGGKGLQVLVEPLDERIAPAFAELVDTVHRGRIKRLALERVDGEPVVGSEWEARPDRARLPRRDVEADPHALKWAPASGRTHGDLRALILPYLCAMPEGDTIHYAANRIRPVLEGHVPDEIRTPHRRFARDRWPERLQGRGVRAVDARGKHLMIRFEGGLTIHSHLRMTGSWQVHPLGRSGGGTRAARGW